MRKRMTAAVLACALLTSVISPGLTAYAADTETNRSLTALNTQNSSITYLKYNNYVYSVQDDETIIIYKYKGTDKNAVVPEEIKGMPVTVIANSIFENCTDVESITLPKGITSISKYAFKNCANLKSITIPDTVTEINYEAFYGCSSLEELYLPSSVQWLGHHLFHGCSSLKTINLPEGITRIGDDMFSDCTSLRNIDLPESITEISSLAFSGCTALESITIPESVEMLEIEAFGHCSSLKSVVIPENVSFIGETVFLGCASLEEVTLPNNIPSICYGLFQDCTSLKEINIPDSVTSIADNAFSGCANLKEVTIPANLETIGTNSETAYDFKRDDLENEFVIIRSTGAFYGCKSLTEINLPDTVTDIGYGAFSGCTGLKDIKLPKSLLSVSNNAFKGCTGLTEIEVPDNVRYLSGFTDCTNLKKINIPRSVSTIGNEAFKNCSGITELHMFNNVKSIGTNAFYNCQSLTRITIPECLISSKYNEFDEITTVFKKYFERSKLEDIRIDSPDIAPYAFYYCKKIKSITLLNDSTEIDKTSFARCNYLQSISNLPPQIVSKDYEDGSSVLKEYFDSDTNLESITLSKDVKSIGKNALADFGKVKEITIPDSVETIGERAFAGCSRLQKAAVPRSVTSIDKTAFADCSYATIYCYKNSYAEEFAKENGIPFVENEKGTLLFDSGDWKSSNILFYVWDETTGEYASKDGWETESSWGNAKKLSGTPTEDNKAVFESYEINLSGRDTHDIYVIFHDPEHSEQTYDCIINASAFGRTATQTDSSIPDPENSGLTLTEAVYSSADDIGTVKFITPDGNIYGKVIPKNPDGTEIVADYIYENLNTKDSKGSSIVTVQKVETAISEFGTSQNQVWKKYQTYSDREDAAEKYNSDEAKRVIYDLPNTFGQSGDINGDSKVDEHDYLYVMNAAVGAEASTPDLLKLADVDNDGEITSLDGLYIIRHAVHIEDEGINIGSDIYEDSPTPTVPGTVVSNKTKKPTAPGDTQYKEGDVIVLSFITSKVQGLSALNSVITYNKDAVEAYDLYTNKTKEGKYYELTDNSRYLTICANNTDSGFKIAVNTKDPEFGTNFEKDTVLINAAFKVKKDCALSDIAFTASLTRYAVIEDNRVVIIEDPDSYYSIDVNKFNSGETDTDTESKTDTDTQTDTDTDTDTDSGSADTDTQIDTDTNSDSDTDIGNKDTDTNTDTDTSSQTDTDTDSDSDTDTNTNTDSDTDTNTDTNTDTDSDSETDTDTDTDTEIAQGPAFSTRTIDTESVEITKYNGTETTVNIPDTLDGKKVVSIGSNAFEGNDKITRITIPNTVNSIGDFAFRNCTSLVDINIPYSVTSIGDSTLYGTPWLENYPGDFVIMGSDILIAYKGSGEKVDIPNTVTNINDSVFQNHTEISRISIPASVKRIGNNAYYGCTALPSITIPRFVTEIGSNAFYGCTALTGITVPDSVTVIGSYAFSKCINLSTVNLSKNITEIGSSTFEGCKALQSITIPNSVTTIGSYAFNQSALQSITIPNSVTTIGSNAFDHSSLQSITIPNSVTTIGSYAFNFSKLQSVTIPESVESIGEYAFDNCFSLTKVTILNPNIDIMDTPLFHVSKKVTIEGYRGSTAEAYASKLNIPFTALDKEDDPKTDDPKTDDPKTEDPKKDDPKQPTQPKTIGTYGEIDGDGSITSADSLLILRQSVQLENFTDNQKKLSDVDGDGSISSADALEVLRYSVKLPSDTSIGKTLTEK